MRLPDGSQLSWSYDKKSNLLAETAADGATTQYVRDLRGLPVRITDAKGDIKDGAVTVYQVKDGSWVALETVGGNTPVAAPAPAEEKKQ